MEYAEFFTRFGGSARSKNLGKASAPPGLARSLEMLRPTSGLPREFVRLDPWEIEFLFGLAGAARVGILEIGRFNGGSTFLLAAANPDVAVYSIDIAPQDDDRLAALFAEHGVGSNVRLIVGDSHLPQPAVGRFDLLFIDGDHSYAACAADIAAWEPRLAAGGHLVFHDSYPAPGYGVQEAIADYLSRKGADARVVVSPQIPADHWRVPHGSLCCIEKRR